MPERSHVVADIMLGVRPTSDLEHARHGQLKGVARAANFALFPPDENTCSQPGNSSPMSEQPSPAMQRMEQQVPLEQQSGVQQRHPLSPLNHRVSSCSVLCPRWQLIMQIISIRFWSIVRRFLIVLLPAPCLALPGIRCISFCFSCTSFNIIADEIEITYSPSLQMKKKVHQYGFVLKGAL